MNPDPSAYRIPVAELRAFVAAVFRATGSSDVEARIVGDHLVDANLAGHESHGVIRVTKYVAIAKARQSGFCAMSIRNAGHLGRIGAWAEQAAHAGLASIHFVNTSG